MKSTSIILFLSLWLNTVVNAQVTGNAFLTNNSDIVSLASNSTLSPVSLQSGSIEYVTGSVSGVWQDTITYIVDGDIVINQGDLLVIKPGTQIKFNGFYNFQIKGQLSAIGNNANPIVITSNKTNPSHEDWGLINFTNTVNNFSILSYCIIKYGTSIKCDHSNPVISNNIIKHTGENALWLIASSAEISHNVISDFEHIGIFANLGNALIIDSNELYGNRASSSNFGLYVDGGNCIIRNNNIHDIAEDYHLSSTGIYVKSGTGEDIKFYNNIVNSCRVGIDIRGAIGESEVSVYNNTIYAIFSAGIVLSNANLVTIKNNIITGNDVGIRGATNQTNNPLELTYNLLSNSNNFVNIGKVGIGNIVTTNSNGTASDTYYNIFTDPLVINSTSDLSLSSNSPCIDAGDNTLLPIVNDIVGNARIWDGNNNGTATVDIGAYEFGSINTSIKEQGVDNFEIQLFPNPNNGQFTIKLENTIFEMVDITIYSTIGGIVYTERINSIELSKGKEIFLDKLSTGIYYMTINCNNKVYYQKVIIE